MQKQHTKKARIMIQNIKLSVNIINSKIKKGKDKVYFESLNKNTVQKLREANYNVKKYNTIFSSYKYCVNWNPKNNHLIWMLFQI